MTDSIRCPICLYDYDSKERIPKLFPKCGHTICKECLKHVLNMDKPQCPFDKINFAKGFRSIDAFPTNVLVKDLLEIESLWSKCSTHNNEAKKFICLTDNQLVCGNCVMFGEHEGHDVRLLSDLFDQAKGKKEQLEDISGKMSQSLQKMNSSLEQNYKSIKDICRQRFEKMRIVINQQERALMSKLDVVFREEKVRIDNIMMNSSDLSRKIQDQLKVFSEIRSNPNILKLVEEDFSDLKKMVDEKITTTEIQQFKELLEISSLLQGALPREESFFKEADITGTLSKEFDAFKRQRDSEQHGDVIKLSAELIISHNNETGAIHISTSTLKNSYTFKKSDLKQVSKASYNLKIKNEMQMNLILPSIVTLAQHLTNVNSIKINFDSDSKTINHEAAFNNLVLATFIRPENLKSISLNVSSLIVKDTGALHLFNNVIPRIKDLEKLHCKFNKSYITGTVLKSIADANFNAMPNLKTFKLNLSDTLLYEPSIIDFLAKIPNVKKLSLLFDRTLLSNKALETFATDILPGLDKVASLKVGLSGTKITDTAVEKFMANLPSISNLEILLNGLNITDASLQSFFENKLQTFTNKPDLKIEVETTMISAEFRQKYGLLSSLAKLQHQTKSIFQSDTFFSKNLNFALPTDLSKALPVCEQQQTNKFGSSWFSDSAYQTIKTLTKRPPQKRAFA